VAAAYPHPYPQTPFKAPTTPTTPPPPPAATLAGAIAAWQSRQSLERVLTTGFLDGTHPLVDAYELSVRLDHMLRRLAALQAAATAEAPLAVGMVPRLFFGGAVVADSHHLLVHLGITHIVNATEVC